MDTHTKDITGRTIKLGDRVGYEDDTSTFTVVFEDNAFRKHYEGWDEEDDDCPILECGDHAAEMRLKVIVGKKAPDQEFPGVGGTSFTVPAISPERISIYEIVSLGWTLDNSGRSLYEKVFGKNETTPVDVFAIYPGDKVRFSLERRGDNVKISRSNILHGQPDLSLFDGFPNGGKGLRLIMKILNIGL